MFAAVHLERICNALSNLTALEQLALQVRYTPGRLRACFVKEIEVLIVLICRSLRWTIILALVAFALTATPSQAQVTFTGPSTINVTEDGSSPIFFYKLTNNSGGPLSNLGVGVNPGNPSGDLSDDFLVGTWTACGPTLADGANCDYSFQFTTDNGAGETDGDFFTQDITLHAFFNSIDPVNGGLQPQDLSQLTVLTISDPTATPEPASLVLLGSGVLGMLGTLRRKLRS